MRYVTNAAIIEQDTGKEKLEVTDQKKQINPGDADTQ